MSFYDHATFLFNGSGGAYKSDISGTNSAVHTVKPAPVVRSGGAQDLSGFSASGVTDSANSISVSGGVATFVGDGSEFTVLQKDAVLEENKNYKVVITANITTGAIKIQDGQTDSLVGTITESGTYAFYFTSGSDAGTNAERFRIARRDSQTEAGARDKPFNFTVSDLSIFEVDSLPRDFDFNRASSTTATRINKKGLVEKGRENLLVQSNQFDTTWVKHNSAVTSGQSGYDGTNNAWQLKMSVPQANSTISYIRQESLSVGNVSTFSVYVKAGNVNWVRLNALTSGTNVNNYFDLSGNGAVGASPSNTVIESLITSVGNGWFRISLSSKGEQDITSVRIYIAEADGDEYPPTNSYIYIQNAQLEAGLVPTEYIPSASTIGRAGILPYQPRIDYAQEASTGTATYKADICGGLMLEPASTNSFNYSEYFAHSYWTKTRTTVVTNADTSPEGVKNASKVLETATTGTHILARGLVFEADETYSVSIFVKAAGRSRIRIQSGLASVISFNASFNLDTGTVTADTGNGTARIQAVGNDGWYRCMIDNSHTVAASDTTTNFNVFILDDSGNDSYAGDTSKGILVYGAHRNKGLVRVDDGVTNRFGYNTSYIPNHGLNSATRATETGSSVTENRTIVEGDFSYLIDLKYVKNGGNGLWSFLYNSPTANNRSAFIYNMCIGYHGSSDASEYDCSPSSGPLFQFKPQKVVFTLDTVNDIVKIYYNGSFEHVDRTISTTHEGVRRVSLLYGADGAVSYKNIAIFPSALSSTDAKILTGATAYSSFRDAAANLNYTTYE